jgi:hypothetical protein
VTWVVGGLLTLEDAVIAATHEDGTPARVPMRFAGSNLVVQTGAASSRWRAVTEPRRDT